MSCSTNFLNAAPREIPGFRSWTRNTTNKNCCLSRFLDPANPACNQLSLNMLSNSRRLGCSSADGPAASAPKGLDECPDDVDDSDEDSDEELFLGGVAGAMWRSKLSACAEAGVRPLSTTRPPSSTGRTEFSLCRFLGCLSLGPGMGDVSPRRVGTRIGERTSIGSHSVQRPLLRCIL